MAVDDKTPETEVNAVPSERTNTPNSSSSPATLPTPVSETHTPAPPSTEDRSLLLSKARSFLRSPQIANQDLFAKRQFLREKGFHEPEIDSLLQDASSSSLVVPPRTYPQPPPSNLPNLLLGLSRVFSWLAGGSALLVFVYYRFLLPRITQSYMARHTLKSHHLTLMRRLTTSLSSFKESQAEAWSTLPKADPWREPTGYSKYSSVDDVTSSFPDGEEGYDGVPPVTILRCGLTDLTKGQDGEQKPTTEELFRYLEEKIPWLLSDDGLKYEQRLWEVLSSCPLFTAIPPLTSSSISQAPQPPTCWSYSPPLPSDPSPVVKSLSSLKISLPKDQGSKSSVLQNTLQTLSEFTGYISTQVYMPYRPPTSGAGIGSNLSPVEEQLRREIRALKGLVLNRRSFMPSVVRAPTLLASTP